MLAGTDVVTVLTASLAAGLVNAESTATALWSAALLPLWIVSAKLHGLYDSDRARIRHVTLDEVPALFRWATVSTAGATLILSIGPQRLSAVAAVTMWALAFGGAVAARSATRLAWRRTVPAERALVIGEGALADALSRKLALEPGHHVTVVAAVALEPPRAEPAAVAPWTDRRVAELEERIRRAGAERVVLAVQDLDEDTLSGVVATCRSLGVKLSVAPPLRAMLGTAVRLNHLAELPLIEFKTWDHSRSTMFLKRAADATAAAVGLVLLAPLLLVVAALIRLDSPGSPLFWQERVGLGGRRFRLVKFRTMVRDAEARLEQLVRLEELPEPMFKLRADPRVTRVGGVLRKTSLDELPQLWNVLKGDMSLVGPRPEESRLAERYGEELAFRLQMRPGITGPMQVHGRGELTFQERAAVEREYVENYSLRKDLQLLLRTIAAVAGRRGAY